MADVITRLILETDGAREAEKSIAGLIDTQEKLNKAIREAAKDTNKTKNETDDLVDQYKKAITAEKELREAVDRTNDEFGERRKVLQANEEFGRATKGVELAGDVESNLRTVGGAAGAFGLQGVERGISQVSEIPAVIEALPRLKAAVAGMPGVLREFTSSLGPAGLALSAVAIVGVALISEITKAEAAAAERLGVFIDSYRELQLELARGSLTTDEATKRIETASKAREVEAKLLEEIQTIYDARIQGERDLGLSMKLIDQTEEELFQQIQKSEKATREYTAEIDLLENALEDGSLATANAIEAERELAQLRLDDARFAGELAELTARSSEFTQDQIDAELRRIELQEIRLEAEREALESLDDQTDETKERIEELNEALDKLGQKSEILENTEPVEDSEKDLASARDTTTKVNKEATKAERDKADVTRKAEANTRKLEQAQQKADQAQQKYTQSVSNAGTAFDNAIDDINQSLKDSAVDTQTDLGDELTDITTGFNRDELLAVKSHNRDLKKIKTDSEHAERGALKTRNFLALSEARDAAQDSRDELKEEFEAEGDDRLLEAQYQRTDIVEEKRRETRDLEIESNRQARDASIQRNRSITAARDQLNIQEQALTASLNMLRQWGQTFVQIQQEAFQTSGTSGGTGDFLQLIEQQRFGAGL